MPRRQDRQPRAADRRRRQGTCGGRRADGWWQQWRHNYPSLVAAKLGAAKHIDVSCGSAETKHMTEPQIGLQLGGTNPPQFDGLRADASLVTVGIGGNDAGLVGVAEMVRAARPDRSERDRLPRPLRGYRVVSGG